MKRWISLQFLMLLLLLGTLYAQEVRVLVVDKDNNSTFLYQNSITIASEYNLISTLSNIGYDYTHEHYLPTNIDQYDVILITLGFYCPG